MVAGFSSSKSSDSWKGSGVFFGQRLIKRSDFRPKKTPDPLANRQTWNYWDSQEFSRRTSIPEFLRINPATDIYLFPVPKVWQTTIPVTRPIPTNVTDSFLTVHQGTHRLTSCFTNSDQLSGFYAFSGDGKTRLCQKWGLTLSFKTNPSQIRLFWKGSDPISDRA